MQSSLSDTLFQNAFKQVNEQGYAIIPLENSLPPILSKELYLKMNQQSFREHETGDYNEISFYWPEDWQDIKLGLKVFHENFTIKEILTDKQAMKTFSSFLEKDTAKVLMHFAKNIKNFIIKNHHGLKNNKLHLARVILRQANENQNNHYRAPIFHEDHGYLNRPYRQLVSAIITTYGNPTIGKKYNLSTGDLILFNTTDRRKLLGLNEEQAFIHKGPKNGPRVFFFFEFLGPSNSSH